MAQLDPYGELVCCLHHQQPMTTRKLVLRAAFPRGLRCRLPFCPNNDLDCAWINDAVSTVVSAEIQRLRDILAARAGQPVGKLEQLLDRQLHRLRGERDRLHKSRVDLFVTHAAGDGDETSLTEALKTTDSRLAQLDAEEGELLPKFKKLHATRQAPARFLEFLTNFSSRFRTASPEEQKTLLSCVIQRIGVAERKVKKVELQRSVPEGELSYEHAV